MLPLAILTPSGEIMPFLARATPDGKVFWMVGGEEFAYDPNQPRKPKGDPEGGQWTAVGTGASYVDGQWVDSKGRPITGAKLARLKKLVIPPGWTDVRLNPDPEAHLQAKGVDAAGRTQYRYSAAFAEKNAAAKFARLKSYSRLHDSINKQSLQDMFNKNNPELVRDSAAVVHLINETGMRIGGTSDTKALKKAYGATTLQVRHFVYGADGRAYFSFTGKKGVHQRYLIPDNVREYVERRARSTRDGYAEDHDPIFRTSASSVRNYFSTVSGGKHQVKDMRTYIGTAEALRLVKKMPVPKNKTQFKKQRRMVAKKVAAKLGNTPTLALKAYIDPAVFKDWE